MIRDIPYVKTTLLTKKILDEGLKLEESRRNPPMDEQLLPKNFDIANKKYQEWLHRYGWLLITDALKNLEGNEK